MLLLWGSVGKAPEVSHTVRLLVPIRVSHDVEEGSSPEDQRDVAIAYSDTRPDVKIIFTDVIDYDVSGATPIAERAGVKEWLTPEKINEWDGIGGAEMSRISRDLYDYLGFVRNLIEKRGKIVVDLSDGTDSRTLRGKQTLEDRILQAQRYREFVSEKRAAKARRLSDQGRWDGGRIPFGYRSVQRKLTDDFGRTRTGWFLVKDTEGTAVIAERMIDAAFAGKSNLAIVRELNDEGVKTSLGRQWRDSSVLRILTSPTLAGFVVKMEGHLQTIRRDRDGKPIKFTDDPIITEDRWRDLQDVLKARGRQRGQPQSRHMLWGVAFCRNCSQECEDDLPCSEHDVILYGQRRVKHVEKGDRYWCKKCGFSIDRKQLEGYMEWRLLREVGSNRLMEPKTIRGGDYSAEVIKLERRIERLRMELDQEYDENIERAICTAEGKVAELNQGPREPDRVVLAPVEPPTTIAEHWASLETPKDQNNYLRETLTVFYVDKVNVMGQFGWMALDSANADFTTLRQTLRRMKLPYVETWDEIADQMAGRRSPNSLLERGKVKGLDKIVDAEADADAAMDA
jgi:DNA invertase Pin-like site-specific DNA recombinase